MNFYRSITFCLFLFPILLFAQHKEKDNQWWVGLKTGFNTTNVTSLEHHSVFSYNDGTPQLKNYDLKYKKGYQIGLITVWDFWKNFNLSIQPTYANHKFSYENTFEWESDDNHLKIHDLHEHSFDYIYLPAFVRYEIKLPKMGGGAKQNSHGKKKKEKNVYSSSTSKKNKAFSKTTPYLEVGYFYSTLIGAQKNITRTETIDGFEYDPTNELIGVMDLMNKANHGMSFGGGVSYDIGGSFRVAADITYQMQFDQMVNQKNRFGNQKLALKYYDAYDDSKLGNWNFSIHFLFPLKFVYSGSFKSI